jgi:hypothetical protein
MFDTYVAHSVSESMLDPLIVSLLRRVPDVVWPKSSSIDKPSDLGGK